MYAHNSGTKKIFLSDFLSEVFGLGNIVHPHTGTPSKNNVDNTNVNDLIWFLGFCVSFDVNVSLDNLV